MNNIQLTNVTKRYSSLIALDNVNLTFEENKIYGLLGRNGAGKTTMLNAITGRIFADKGTINMGEERISENQKCLSQIYMSTEKNLFPENMKFDEAMKWTNEFYENFDIDYAKSLANDFKLDQKKKFENLSTGYKTIYKLILALSANTPYLFLDEPVLGLDANFRDLFYKIFLIKYSESPFCGIISTHLVEEISGLVENLAIIKEGKIIYDGRKDDLLSTAYIISGISVAVDEFTKDKNLLSEETLGNLKSAYIKGEKPTDLPDELELSGMDLQKLFIHMTN